MLERPREAVLSALQCTICHGVYRTACTAPECCHSFCYAHLADGPQPPCPVCADESAGSIRFDRALCALATELFPPPAEQLAALREEEARAEERLRLRGEAVRRRPLPQRSELSHRKQPARADAAFTVIRPAQPALTLLDAIVLRLSPELGISLPRPVLRTTPSMEVASLARYIASQLPAGGQTVVVLDASGSPAALNAQLGEFVAANSTTITYRVLSVS